MVVLPEKREACVARSKKVFEKSLTIAGKRGRTSNRGNWVKLRCLFTQTAALMTAVRETDAGVHTPACKNAAL